MFPTLEVAETLFVNAYLTAITTFAKAGKSNLARYASEISGVEAQHLALARFAAGKLPNDLGFTDYSITSIGGIVAALEKAGVGFGKKGSAPGVRDVRATATERGDERQTHRPDVIRDRGSKGNKMSNHTQ